MLGESLAAVRLPDLEDDLDSSASSLSSFAATTESALSAALDRCRQATGSSLTVIVTQRSLLSSHACMKPLPKMYPLKSVSGQFSSGIK